MLANELRMKARRPNHFVTHGARYTRGQVGVVLTLIIGVLLGAVALGTDVAVLYFNWVQLQKAADAAALAGAYYLPNDPTTAKSTAITYAKLNGVLDSEINSPTVSADDSQITVSLKRTVPYYFARVLGLTSGALNVNSTAAGQLQPKTIGVTNASLASFSGGGSGSGGTPNPSCGTSAGGYDVLPIVVNSDSLAADFNSYIATGTQYTLNRGDPSNGNGPWLDAPGNWGMVNLCGGGSSSGSVLSASIANGFYGPISIGDQLQTVPGVKNGPVSQGFATRIGLSSDSPNNFDPSDPRAVIVPMASFKNCSGACTAVVTGFLAFYIDSYSNGGIKGHFVKRVYANSIGGPNVTGDLGAIGNPSLLQ